MGNYRHILEKYGLSDATALGGGMEAKVYAYGNNKALKIYEGTSTFDELEVLRQFYALLDAELVNYSFPQIDEVFQEENCVVTIERFLQGTPLSFVLSSLSHEQMNSVIQNYLTMVLNLSKLGTPKNLSRLKLFDPHQLSQTTEGDWHQFLIRFLNFQLSHIESNLKRDVTLFLEKFEILSQILSFPYEGAYQLIHGDICPGNVLIDEQYHPTALLDFGLLTMYGDPYFDLATSWVFFDMYDELKANLYGRFRDILLDRVGQDKQGLLHRYILIYSILSANTYSRDCSDGHYHWCINNLNNELYWHVIS